MIVNTYTMNNSTLLHKALESVNWDYVHRSFRGLGVQWYGSEKMPSKKDLINDLTEIIEVTFENLEVDSEATQTVTSHWIVCLEEDEETKELLLEIMFTPITLFIGSKGAIDKTHSINLEKLKERLKIALQRENYELAGLIQETLDNYKIKK